ncbi:MAG: gluconate 2-dehydrogenase subunit 3 family protein [Spirosomaceae bacterium]|nr:gluconate 2-dehydrogenase subunit 3 family protein [Spirosomataceae bacterium]
MDRRSALQSLSLTLGGLITLPAWANGWTAENMPKQFFLNNYQEGILAEAVETIIPKTVMIADCYEKTDQANFAKGLETVDSTAKTMFNKSFTAASPAERLQTLQAIEKSEDANTKKFFGTLRRLTIQGYTNSEYYMTNVSKFEFAPGRYLGCVDVKK